MAKNPLRINQRNRSNDPNYVRQAFLDSIYTRFWKTRPVDPLTFLKDKEYLGNSTSFGEAVFECWKKAIQQIFADNAKTLVVLTGAIGIGKSTMALYGVAYIMYLISCLKDPWAYMQLANEGKFVVSFFNLSKGLSDSLGFSKLQHLLLSSPWFRRNASLIYEGKNQRLELPLFRYALSSPASAGFGVQGASVITGILDEVDTPNASTGQKKRVLQAYDATVRRFDSRFVKQNQSLGRLFVVSSKQDEMAFINTFIAEKKSSERTIVFDVPYWESRSRDKFDPRDFYVVLPKDTFANPKLCETIEETKQYADRGHEILPVPYDFHDSFRDDLVGALRDIGGRTMHGQRKNKLFRSDKFISSSFDPQKPDPVVRETLVLGLKDKQQELIWYIDVNKIRTSRSTYRYLHMDFGLTGDALSVAMSGVSGHVKRQVPLPDGTYQEQFMPVVETDFCLRLKAPEGDEIPIYKVRKLVLDLKSLGFNIRQFTADLRLASADTTQLLTESGIECKYLSLDKTPKAYMDFRDLVLDGRWVCHPHKYLFFELKNLEVRPDGKIDHPKKVQEVEFLEDGGVKELVVDGSKDVSDAVVGSVYGAMSDPESRVSMDDVAEKLHEVLGHSNPTAEQEKQEAMKRLLSFEEPGKGVVSPIIKPEAGEGLESFAEVMKRLRR